MISVFICTRSDKSKNTSMNANFITVKMWQQEARHKTCLYTDHAYYKMAGDLRWLDIVFQGQYLPSLSVNYVAINKDLEKLTPQLY